MKKKTAKLVRFIEELNDTIVKDATYRKNTTGKREQFIQAEIRPLIIKYLEKYFIKKGFKRSNLLAYKHSYWEGGERCNPEQKLQLFASRNYPDFIIKKPYRIAIEYKKSKSGSLVKQAVGQSIVHTLSGEYDYVYILFHDENKDGRIEKSFSNGPEKKFLDEMRNKYNVFVFASSNS